MTNTKVFLSPQKVFLSSLPPAPGPSVHNCSCPVQHSPPSPRSQHYWAVLRARLTLISRHPSGQTPNVCSVSLARKQRNSEPSYKKPGTGTHIQASILVITSMGTRLGSVILSWLTTVSRAAPKFIYCAVTSLLLFRGEYPLTWLLQDYYTRMSISSKSLFF